MPVEDIGGWYISTLLDQCADEGGSILVAERGQELLGFATVFTNAVQKGEMDELPFTYAYVSHISVKPSARGGGIGKLLLGECEARARSAGRQWLRIGVLANNPGARSLYERLGFRDHLLIMEKPLK
ncbi:MAG: N-acetyltransferase family protein [Rhizobiaceae bacterium]